MGTLAALCSLALAAPPGALGPMSTPPPPPPSAGWQPPVAPPGMGEGVGLEPPGTALTPRGLSLLGATALPAGEVGFVLGAGFPYATAEILGQALPAVAFYGRLDSLYRQLELVSVGARWTIEEDDRRQAIALRFEAGQTIFGDSEASELAQGPGVITPAWITGLRDQALGSFFTVSTRNDSGMTFSFDGGAQIVVQDFPQAEAGTPPPLALGLNLPMHLLAEVPVGKSTSLAFVGGADLHLLAITAHQGSLAFPLFLVALDSLF